ncbi:MAG: MBOAT family O-acyltransferase [Malacoplasma sp.]
MGLLTANFFAFVAISLFAYYITPKKFRWIVLLASSLYFYIVGSSVKRLILLILMLLITYVGAILIDKYILLLHTDLNTIDKEKTEQKRKRILTLTIVVLLTILIIIQDKAFFVNNANQIGRLFGMSFVIGMPKWASQLGISYFTLMLISYICDVSWEVNKVQKNPFKLLLFTSFFPQMLSGPITRYHDMDIALFQGNQFDHRNIEFGLQRIIWGMFKKLVIAERLSIIVSTIYGNYEVYAGIYVFIAVIGYTLQVYADFSGCMDIVIGISEMFGIKLPENFNTPFYSTSLSEVWRRWHMTLGFWVKDYILYPLLKSSLMQKIRVCSKKRLGKKLSKSIPLYCALFITWFSVGFWHGGSWNYVLGSGLFFFIMIVGGQILEPVFKKTIAVLKINTNCFSWKLFQRFRTFLLFASSVSFGKAASTKAAIDMWKSAFSTFNPWVLFDKSIYNLGVDKENVFVLIISLCIFFIISKLQQTGSIREKLSQQNLLFRWSILLILIFATIIFGMYGSNYASSPFIYGGF